MNQVYILHLESATKVCSVALSRDGKLCQLKEYEGDGYTHGENLTCFIEEVLEKEGIRATDLAAVAVSSGPGSYTGLRIGTSVAKGICYAVGAKLIAINSLEVIANLARKKYPKSFIVPMIDARRMEVYTSVFDPGGTCIQNVEAFEMKEDSFIDLNPMTCCGDGAEKLKSIWSEDRWGSIDSKILSSAEGLVTLSFEKYQKGQFEDVAYFEPFYLKDFVVKKKQK
ncbi:MAG: tRNA (adenosine(37)-N6)-threonylcarbamoyltransferase complex dimerization subunit type 1 TsaB [Bacteroidetes bacterium]|nr:MAG: tRNA (adenosine(37)-N6)-threonylcarbamoyltransferase complex dimerization subunit type 1 TsaB [Bacteroidota bacterium]